MQCAVGGNEQSAVGPHGEGGAQLLLRRLGSDGDGYDLGLVAGLADAPGLDARGPLVPGSLVSETYRVERATGQGGMGVVYLARDERLGPPVALTPGMPADVFIDTGEAAPATAELRR